MRRGKMSKPDIQVFAMRLEDNIFGLHREFAGGIWQHGPYESFVVHDPKRRQIHKPSVRDRLVHHAVVRVVEPLFERTFMHDVWSCRVGKGTHAAVDRCMAWAWSLSRNNTRTAWALKCDIRKFFEQVDHSVLCGLLAETVCDPRAQGLLEGIIASFSSAPGKGLPLGNLTSQLCANVYLNPLDQYLKRDLGLRHVLRYGDDLILLHVDRSVLERALPAVSTFLEERLQLSLHPRKTILQPFHRGTDVLGFVCFPHYRVLRTKTRRRLLRRISEKNATSYFGLLSHGRTRGVQAEARRVLAVRTAE